MVRIIHTSQKNKGPLLFYSDLDFLVSDFPPSPTREAPRPSSPSFILEALMGREEQMRLEDDIQQGDASASVNRMKTQQEAIEGTDFEDIGSDVKKRKLSTPLEVKSAMDGKYISMEDKVTHKPKGTNGQPPQTFKGKTKVVADGIDELSRDSEDEFFRPYFKGKSYLPSHPKPAQDTLKILTLFAKEQRTINTAHRMMIHSMRKQLKWMERKLKISEDRWTILETNLQALNSSSSAFPSLSSNHELGDIDSD